MRPVDPVRHGAWIAERRGDLLAHLDRILATPARIVWEVGSGHGHFLVAYARAHPGETCVGIDLSSDRVARANRKRERERLPNLHFIRADAADFLAVLPNRCRFSAIFVLFPDPWPKRRHLKNRLMTAAFLSDAGASAGKGTPLFFRTDHEPYFREARALLAGHPDWSEAVPRPLPVDEPTVFEKRAPRHFTLVAERR